MKIRIKTLLVSVALMLATCEVMQAQGVSETVEGQVKAVVASKMPQNMGIGSLNVRSIKVDEKVAMVDVSENFGSIPFTMMEVEQLKGEIKQIINSESPCEEVKLTISGDDISLYFADYELSYKRSNPPFISAIDPNKRYTKGLDGNVIAVWQSHGWYFEPLLNRWEWQRARIMQTVEDMYTQSYVVPFLIPMLENAGAYVWDARERDTHLFSVVVDNDGEKAQSGYEESSKGKKWEQGAGEGFAYKKADYRDFENPFRDGTYRQVACTTDKKEVSSASWSADMPEAGTYALYISYKSLPNSANDALYTVNSQDGTRQFKVDQTMAGGVWVYLGTFQLKEGLNKDVVVLNNLSKDKNAVVTADGIKIGGGMGNIARRVALPTPENIAIAKENGDEKYLGKPGVDYKYVLGDRPWYTIGSRYYLQWAGFPDSVYSTSKGINDYVDDYRCRGEWVNYLAGGSRVLPNRGGLNVPVDLSLAWHTDAGLTDDDEIVGTLGIYCTRKNGKNFGRYEDGTSREMSRNYTNLVMTEICNDIRAKYEPNWTRRGMRDASYYEARVPEVPAMLLELLSHQNFADMKYGLDPSFRFTVSRAVYKGMLKFIAQRDHRDYVVQPLPVNSFAIRELDGGRFLLSWKPTKDDLSTNADPKKYVVCEKVGNGGFKEIAIVPGTEHLVTVTDNEIHSYKIVAMNEGGRSFPSEVLSLGVAKGSKGMVMVVNGFTRVSAPDWFDSGEIAGFNDAKDHGVPYMQQINYLGAQFEFRRNQPWRDDDAGGFGASRSNYETAPIAGNTFNYPEIHGEAIMNAGYSFVSSSVEAVETGEIVLDAYKTTDLILGKQKEIQIGRGAVPNKYKAFTPALRSVIMRYCKAGGNVFVTGAYVGSDIWDKENPNNDEVAFAKNVLGYEFLTGQATLKGEVYTVPTTFKQIEDGRKLSFVNKLNQDFYAVESPDGIKASDSNGATIMRYAENNIPAGIASDRSGYRTVILGFPFETIKDKSERNSLMGNVLDFFTK